MSSKPVHYRKGDVVLVSFPYTTDEGTTQTKRRPAVIISNDYNNARLDDVLLVPLTSNTTRAGREPTQVVVAMESPEGKAGGLRSGQRHRLHRHRHHSQDLARQQNWRLSTRDHGARRPMFDDRHGDRSTDCSEQAQASMVKRPRVLLRRLQLPQRIPQSLPTTTRLLRSRQARLPPVCRPRASRTLFRHQICQIPCGCKPVHNLCPQLHESASC